MGSMKLSGVALIESAAGFVLLWSGLKNQSISDVLKESLSGNRGALTTKGSFTTQGTPTVGITSSGGPSDNSNTKTPSNPGGKTTPPGTGPGGTTPPATSGNPGAVNGCTAKQTAANKATGKLLAAAYGWSTGQEWDALNGVVMLESGWCNTAQNPTSTAYGIGQFLDSTWKGTGYKKTSNATTQIAAMLKYIKSRYGDPEAAYSFHIQNGYY